MVLVVLVLQVIQPVPSLQAFLAVRFHHGALEVLVVLEVLGVQPHLLGQVVQKVQVDQVLLILLFHHVLLFVLIR